MNALACELRAAARTALPEGAFLRRDRGDALFVTDAPRLCPGVDLNGTLARAGFDCEARGGLLLLTPSAGWLAALERRYPEPPDALSAGLSRFAGLPADGGSLRLFALGARLLDGEPDDGRFERRLRQRTAECLRINRTNPDREPIGGGLYACALLIHQIKEEH